MLGKKITVTVAQPEPPGGGGGGGVCLGGGAAPSGTQVPQSLFT